MAKPARESIGELLAGMSGRSSFTARRTASCDDLHLEVSGVGPIRFPVSRAQARKLADIARPARYGKGQRTLMDARVRDTGEIPKSRVKIDRRRWNLTLLPVLDRLRHDLGIPDGSTLRAQLHSMLVYGPGQFFLPHQDSEKSDDMVGTLVVTLPSSFKGGAFVIEHRGEKVTYRASKQALSFVAFYADCRHEVRPVTEGYRIVLTYNLSLELVPTTALDGATVDELAVLIREHFATPVPAPSWSADAAPREPPARLIYLLDHQYSQRGLGWDRLKGTDAARVAALRAAAERSGCEMVLALADVHETWSTDEDDWDWYRDEDEEWYSDDDDPRRDDPDRYRLTDLQDWDLTLHHWIGAAGRKAEPISTDVRYEEVCDTTPSSALEPYASEHEGYMGNYGNTMDRWYRRAATVLWPHERAFAVRAEASPAWALETLRKRIRAGAVSEARAQAQSLLPFWKSVATREERRGFFDKALSVAEGLDAPEVATSLLQPFRMEELTPKSAAIFLALVNRYGEAWTRSLLAAWSATRHNDWLRSQSRNPDAWLASLPRLSNALQEAGDNGAAAARLLVSSQWSRLRAAVEEARGLMPPSQRNKALNQMATPTLAFLESVVLTDARGLHRQAMTFLCARENEPLLPLLISVLRTARASSYDVEVALRLDPIEQRCARLLEQRLAVPARDRGDWSIAAPEDCRCDLCVILTGFLNASDRRLLEWPLAKEKRRHIHTMIDSHELPVRHETRRSGSPYRLVLTKMSELFEREAADRRSWQADLDWIRSVTR